MPAAPREISQNPSADEIAEEDIVERIFEAVVDQRLPPGTKLSESALCEAFGVGRMRIRRSLLLLSSREVVELHAIAAPMLPRPPPNRPAKSSRRVWHWSRRLRGWPSSAPAPGISPTLPRILGWNMRPITTTTAELNSGGCAVTCANCGLRGDKNYDSSSWTSMTRLLRLYYADCSRPAALSTGACVRA